MKETTGLAKIAEIIKVATSTIYGKTAMTSLFGLRAYVMGENNHIILSFYNHKDIQLLVDFEGVKKILDDALRANSLLQVYALCPHFTPE